MYYSLHSIEIDTLSILESLKIQSSFRHKIKLLLKIPILPLLIVVKSPNTSQGQLIVFIFPMLYLNFFLKIHTFFYENALE